MMDKSLFSSQSIEWYTPPELLAEVVAFLGRIDLDPARPELGNGLGMTWRGRVFLNPPYGRHIGKWISKAMSDPVDELILLIPARTETRWFQPVWDHTICFMVGRIRFVSNQRVSRSQGAPFPTVLVYRGSRPEAFAQAFAHHGHVVIGAPAQPQIYQLPLEVA